MKILVTGGGGYIGSRLVKALKGHGDVHSLDRKKTGENCIIGDICDPALDLSGFDVVYHLAAMPNASECEKDKERAWRINTFGTMNIASKIRPGARLVFAGSAQSYAPSNEKHSEEEELSPPNFYGLTKQVGEDAVKYFSSKIGYKYAIMRLFNAYSSDQPPGFLVSDVIAKYKAQKEIEIPQAMRKMDMVHVDDAVAALVRAGEIEGTYNVCSGKGETIQVIYWKIRDYVGAKEVKEKILPGGAKHLLGDNSRLVSLGLKFGEFSLP